MSIKLEIGNEKFEILPNFKMSLSLSKYRTKLNKGIDYSILKPEALKEIEVIREKIVNNEMTIEDLDISSLSPEAIEILQKMGESGSDLFNYEEIIDIGNKLLNKEEQELIELFDKEVEMNGYDVLMTKLSETIQKVFMNAKDGTSKKNNPVAKKKQ